MKKEVDEPGEQDGMVPGRFTYQISLSHSLCVSLSVHSKSLTTNSRAFRITTHCELEPLTLQLINIHHHHSHRPTGVVS